MNQTPILPLWNRQAQLQRHMTEDKDMVYEISAVSKAHPNERGTVIAMTSKTQALKMLTERADKTPYMYRVQMFQNPQLKGIEHTR